ncbi:MAG: BamA/TamA family outer membrane protein [Acidobacteriales bacterium]|nr:BamA/TamA family outer membrane protein [Terriglobales bacterium]
MNNIVALYRDAGYEDVKVEPRVVDHEPKVDINFEITEGARTVVQTWQLEGNEHIPLKKITHDQEFRLYPGSPFSTRRLADDRNRIAAEYLDRGYLNVDVKSTVTRQADPHKVDVLFAVTEHQQVRISKVLLMGQRHTRRALIETAASVSSEAAMSESTLLQGESQLYDTGIFDWSSVGPRRPINIQTEEEALVKVHEAKRNTLTYGFGIEIARRGGNVPTGTVAVPGLPTIGLGNAKIAPSESTFTSPRGTIEYTRRNIRGLGETGAISLLGARLDQRALLTYTDPHFRRSAWGSLFSLSAERSSENPLFTARLGDASLQFERPIDHNKTTTLQIRYDFNKTVLTNLLVPQLVLSRDTNVRLSTLSSTIIHDTRDRPLDAHRGVYGTLDLRITPTGLGSSANFARLLGQYAYYRPIRHIVWANSARLGLAAPFAGSFVPTSQLFFSGGGTTLRGFSINAAGPQRIVPFCTNPNTPSTCTNITVPVGGQQLVILNSELRFPLAVIENLGGVVFYDGGNVYSHVNFRQFVNDYSNTVGIGLRYNTPVGPVRIDVGRNLNPVPGLKRTQFFITLGQAF